MAKEKDPFAEFEDWLVDGPAGEWHYFWEYENSLTTDQDRIVRRNAALLLDRAAWTKRVDDFELAINTLPNKTERREKRALFHIRFDLFEFEGVVKDFHNYYFPCSTYFIEANFGQGNVDFSRTKFASGDVDFHCVKFGNGTVSFSNAQFGEGFVNFSQTQFGNGSTFFSGALFGKGDVDFTNAAFGNGSAAFRAVQFGVGDVYFTDAEFMKSDVDFSHMKFGEGVVYLIDSKLPTTSISARDIEVAGSLYVKAHFLKAVDFQRLKVGESASFSGCKFEQVPDFRDAKFDRPPDVANMEVSRPKLKIDRFWPFSTAEDPDDASRLRKLKTMALDAGDHERDSYFFAREMLAKRGVETTKMSGLLLNTLYGWFSIYGYSFLRPLGWLATSFTLFFIIYTHIVEHCFHIANMRAFPMEHSFRNFLPLIGGLFRYAPTPDKYTSPYEKLYAQLPDADITLLVTLGIVQSIIGGVLLFLFLLALRNRFRLK